MDEGARRISVVTATYNEAENISEFIDRVERALEGYEFELVIVDDDSPDGTADIARRAGSKYGNVRVIVRRGERGLASALLAGIASANCDYVVVMDADLQHPPEMLPVIVDLLLKGGVDLVVASRYASGGSVRGWSIWRRLVSRVAICAAHLLVPRTRGVRDPVSGFFGIKRELVLREKESLRTGGYKLLVEILARCDWRRVAEVPYAFQRRERGESKLGAAEIVGYLAQILRLARLRFSPRAEKSH